MTGRTEAIDAAKRERRTRQRLWTRMAVWVGEVGACTSVLCCKGRRSEEEEMNGTWKRARAYICNTVCRIREDPLEAVPGGPGCPVRPAPLATACRNSGAE